MKRVGQYKRISVDEVKRRIFAAHGCTVTLDETTFINTITKARFIDVDYGEWWALPTLVAKRRGHPLRGNSKIAQSKQYSIDRVVNLVTQAHGDAVTFDVSTYVDMQTKARFVDSIHGEWWTPPGSVTKGHGHPNRKFTKSAKTLRCCPVVLHWKTGAECISQSSYEYATLLWLNRLRYDFEWQVPFETPFLKLSGKKRVYYVDLYIKDGPLADTYVEIKGTWYRTSCENSRKKWDWFHAEHSNSALWMKPQLTELGILHGKETPPLTGPPV